MKWTIGNKISGLITLTIAMSLILCIISLHMTSKLKKSIDSNLHTYQVLQNLEQIISLLKDAETGGRGYIITGEEQYLEPYNMATIEIIKKIDFGIALNTDNPKQEEQFNKVKLSVIEKISVLQKTIDARKKMGFNAALKIVNTDKGKNIMDNIRNVISEMEQTENDLLKIRNHSMNNDISITKSIIIYGSFLSIILITIIGFLIIRNISGPLKKITMIASRIASNDLSVDISPTKRNDEIGLLNLAFYQMVEQLRASINDITEGINLLGSSASEILASTTQVASGAAETAAAISETTTTIEEVRQAAQLSSQKASRVSENAHQIAQITKAGQLAVEGAINGMNEIQNQMDLVANTIVRLSEQSQQIGGIIASVNDVADQSNLLAVNASIEAAKAGEIGRGFAVVAIEIKGMAQQSKQATLQVRNILSDIQKATSAAVMATEQTSKAVEKGVKLSTQTGESIQKMADSSNNAVDAATQIVASSQQQVIGMDQIAIAMQNINQAGIENAASMIQAEKAAKGISDLGLKLKHLVDQYKV